MSQPRSLREPSLLEYYIVGSRSLDRSLKLEVVMIEPYLWFVLEAEF